jgi:4-amino-4-deoxy-L-arabinose transferase-like glycosyltransferase
MLNGNRYLRNVLIIALAVRMLFIVAVLIFPVNLDYGAYDSEEYIALAKELASSGRFFRTGIHPTGVSRVDVPEIVRTPGYPLFLIPGVILGNIEVITVLFQIILSCLTVLLVYRIAANLFIRRDVAFIASLLVALDPMSIFYSVYIRTETLFTFIIAAFIYSLVRYLENFSLQRLLMAALIFLASIFVRPISYYFPILFVIVFMIFHPGNIKRKIFILHAVAFLVVSMAPTMFWENRNKLTTGYAGFSAIQDVNIYFFNAAGLSSIKENVPFKELQTKMGMMDLEDYFKYHPEQKTWNESERYNYMREEGLRVIGRDFWAYTILHAKGMFRVLLDPGMVKYTKLFKFEPEGQYLGAFVDRSIIRNARLLYEENTLLFGSYLVFGAIQLLMCCFLIAGLFPTNISYNTSIIFLVSIGLYFLLLSGGPGDGPRFRLQILPVYAILSAYGVFACWDKIKVLISRK